MKTKPKILKISYRVDDSSGYPVTCGGTKKKVIKNAKNWAEDYLPIKGHKFVKLPFTLVKIEETAVKTFTVQ